LDLVGIYMTSTRYSCQILTKLDFPPADFRKKKSRFGRFNQIPSSVSRVFPFRRTDRQTDRYGYANTRFSQFSRTRLSCSVFNRRYCVVIFQIQSSVSVANAGRKSKYDNKRADGRDVWSC